MTTNRTQKDIFDPNPTMLEWAGLGAVFVFTVILVFWFVDILATTM